MNASDVLPAVIGGLLIGAAAAVYLLGAGRIAGISGIFGNVLSAQRGGVQLAFLAGLLAAPWLLQLVRPTTAAVALDPNWIKVVVAGALVGVGTYVGSGCTSGHGVCGLANFSLRGFVATLTFMLVAAILVALNLGGL